MSVSIALDYGTTFMQWEKDRYIYIEGYTSSDRVKVHFTTSESGVAFSILPIWDNDKWRAGVPNTVLTAGLPVNIYVYNESGVGAERTVYKYVVPVDTRAKPADYIFDAYDRNTLQWPYEENIEEILRSSTIIFQSEDERVAAEAIRRSDELIRVSNEQQRVLAESQRQDNETQRQTTMSAMEQALARNVDVVRELSEARGTYPTLNDRLNLYGLNRILSGIRIDNSGNIIVTSLDGRDNIVGVLEKPEGYYIEDIRRTGGTGLPGSTDQYTITLNNEEQYPFNVYNGADGATFIPSITPDGTLRWSNNKGLENPPDINLMGARGFTFTPSVAPDGTLSWTNNGDLPNPPDVNIRGLPGEVAYMFTPHVSPEGVLSWTNDGGMENPAPVNLRGTDGNNGVTFIPSVDQNGVLSWTNNGDLPNPPDKMINGIDGTTFIPSVSESGDLSWSNNDNKPNPATRNIRGPIGLQGITFTPTVDENGNLSWTNNGGLANPATVNIKGIKGDTGSGGDADSLQGHEASYFATANHTHSTATANADGFMSSTDKGRLDTMTNNGSSLAQDVGVNASPTFNVVTAAKIIGAVYA